MFFGKNHFGKYTLIKNTIAKLSFLAISLLAGFALVLFVNNYFPFLPQVELYKYLPEASSDDIDDFVSPPSETPNDDSTDNRGDGIVHTPTAADFIASCTMFDENAINAGYYISDLPYDGAKYRLMRLTPDIQLPLYYSISEATEPKTPAVWPRMGFIIVQKADLSLALLDTDGKFLCDIPENMMLISARDEGGNPIFTSSDGYFNYSRELNAFVPSSYNTALDIHGAAFDFPSYYDAPTEDVHRVHGVNAGSWGFRHADGRQIVSGIYSYAYQFSQGYGAVATQNGRISIHNVNGYRRFTDHSFYMPETNGIESLGFYSFDHGLMRVREAKYDWRGNKTYDREYVIHLGNNEFFMPQDYKIETYFDGVFLLSKDGKYGYFNYLGEWICQPIYTYATPFIEGIGVVGYADGKKGIVDENGRFVVPMLFDEIARCSGGVMALYNENEGWNILCKVTSDSVDIAEPPQEDNTAKLYPTNIAESIAQAHFESTYIAEQAAYDYTVWMYFNPVPTEVVSPLESIMQASFAPTYIAEKAAYDYTIWLSELDALTNAVSAVPFSVSYAAERASYDYTIWLYLNPPYEMTPIEKAVGVQPFISTYIADISAYNYTIWLYNNAFPPASLILKMPFVPSYIAESAAYNYTVWLYDRTAIDDAFTADPLTPSYIAERAAFDYTLWLYNNRG